MLLSIFLYNAYAFKKQKWIYIAYTVCNLLFISHLTCVIHIVL